MAQFCRYTFYSQSENQQNCGNSFIQRGDIYLDPQRHVVRVKERSVRLRRREFLLLKYFMENPKVILSAEQICEEACAISCSLQKTECELAAEVGISQLAIHKRKEKILRELKFLVVKSEKSPQ